MDNSFHDRKSRAVTLRDIAERCGVSVASVSLALRGDRGNVSEEKITIITRTAREMGYDPTRYQAARRLVSIGSGRDLVNYIVAFYVPPQFYNVDYYHLIFSGVMDAMMPERYGVLALYPPTNQGAIEFARPIVQGDVDGLISAISPKELRRILPRLRSEPSFHDRPVVSLVNKLEGASAVVADDYSGGYQAIKHLLELGHRHFLHFHHADQDTHEERVRAFRDAVCEYGLDPDTHLIRGNWSEDYPEQSATGALETLLRNPQATAILAFNDVTAIEIANIVRKNGLRIPEDVSIVGFDDTSPLPSEVSPNILTTVTLPLFDIGRQAANLIIRQRTENIRANTDVVMPVTLNVRSSTAPPRAR